MRELLFMEPVFKEAIWEEHVLKMCLVTISQAAAQVSAGPSARIRTGIAVLQAEHGKDRA